MFDVRKSLADLALEEYLFTDAEGIVRKLPNMKLLNLAQAERIYDGDVMQVLPEVLTPESWAAIAAIPAGVLPDLIADWVKHAEATSGESAASSPSTASTARPSKQTSPSGASKTRKR